MFQFSPGGELKRNYGVILDQSKTSGFFISSPMTSDMIRSKSYIQESGDGKNLYWMMRMARSIHKESHPKQGGFYECIYPRLNNQDFVLDWD